MKRIKALIITLIISVGTLSLLYSQGAVATQHLSSGAIDALGREVSLSKPINTIVVAGKAALMPADALFLFPLAMEKEVILAKTDQGLGDFFPLIKPEIASSVRLGQQVGPEEIVKLKADLVITKSSNYDSLGKQLEQFGIPVFVMDLETSESWKSEIVELGKLLGDNETPKVILSEYDKRESEIERRVSAIAESERPTVLVVQSALNDGALSFSISPKNWIQAFLVESVKANPIWVDNSALSNAWSKLSFEQIAQWNPDHIFVIDYRDISAPTVKKLASDQRWRLLDSSLHPTPSDVVNYFQSDSRWILALQYLAKTLYPTHFEDLDMEEEIRSFYKTFYHISDEAILKSLVEAYQSSINL